MTSISLDHPQQRMQSYVQILIAGFYQNRLLYGFAFIVCATAVIEALVLNLPLDFAMVLIFSGPVLIVLLAMIVLGLLMEMIRLARAKHQGSVAVALFHKLRDDYFAASRVSNAVHAFLFMTLYMVGYTFIKKAIPTANPFSWDASFIKLDLALHGGVHPYQWLAPLLNNPWITFVLNLNYNIWFFVMFILWFWQGFARQDHKLRQHFLLGFTLTWFIGTCGLGTLFSSVGPCFYGRLYPGQDVYAPLMAWLTHVNTLQPIWALNVMDELWKNYETGKGLVNGISAMPSMHVGTSILFAILGFASGKRWLGVLLTLFASMILLGSVHLGWHYAIDGYVGALVAGLGWWFAGKLVDWDRSARGVA